MAFNKVVVLQEPLESNFCKIHVEALNLGLKSTKYYVWVTLWERNGASTNKRFR